MVEQWQHMLVSAVAGPNPQFITFPAVQEAAGLVPSASSTVVLLDELGEQGWQLVAVRDTDDLRTGRYWLKRPAPHQD